MITYPILFTKTNCSNHTLHFIINLMKKKKKKKLKHKNPYKELIYFIISSFEKFGHGQQKFKKTYGKKKIKEKKKNNQK